MSTAHSQSAVDLSDDISVVDNNILLPRTPFKHTLESLSSIFTDVDPAYLATIISHQFFAEDLRRLDGSSNCLEITDTNHCDCDDHARHLLNSVISPLCIYFTILSTFYNEEPSIPQVFFQYLKELQHIAAEFEWEAVFEYHTIFFNRCVDAMREYHDFSAWGVPDIPLMSFYIRDKAPRTDVFGSDDTQTLFPIREEAEEEYGSPPRSDRSSPQRALTVILRRTLDTCVDDWNDLQFVSHMQYTIDDSLDLCNVPLGNPGEPFGALETVCLEYSVNAGDSNQTISVSDIAERFLSYEGDDYPYLTVIRFKDHCEAMDRAWNRGMAARPTEVHCAPKEIPPQIHFPEKRWTRRTQDNPPHIKRWTISVRSWLKRQVKNLRPPTKRTRHVLASLVRRNLYNRSMDSLGSFRSLDSDVTIKVTPNILRRKSSIMSYKTLL